VEVENVDVDEYYYDGNGNEYENSFE